MSALDIPPDTATRAFDLLDVASPGPLVFASPHSGRIYPEALLRRTRLPLAVLRKGEDRHVDALLAGVGARGAPCLLARIARAYVDLNRDPAELDPALLDRLPPIVRASERVAAGLGVIPRAFAPGESIYASPVPLEEAQARIADVHVPYHAALARLLARARAVHGYAVLIDCHSMPSLPGGARAVVGDLNGRAADRAIADAVMDVLAGIGVPAVRNIPYAGAYTLERHGRPIECVHAVQIEFDRALYLDGARMTLLPGATGLAARIARFAGDLDARLASIASARAFAVAAE